MMNLKAEGLPTGAAVAWARASLRCDVAPVRVLHVIAKLSGYGAEGFVAALLPRLRTEQFEIGVMPLYDSPSQRLEFAGQAPTLIPVGRRGRYDPTFFPRMVAAVRAWRPSIVHTHTHNGKYWGRLAAFCAGVPVVVHTEHNPCDSRRSALERVADRAFNARSAAIVTFFGRQGLVLAEDEKIPPGKLKIIPNGIEHGQPPQLVDRAEVRRRLGIPADEFAILLVGRMQYQKNHELAIRAVAELPAETRRQIRLFLFGSGPLEPELRALVACEAVDSVVRFMGFRSGVRSLFVGGDLLLVTSRFEGMPLAVIEAMGAGLPVLTTPWIGASDMLDGGRLGFIARGWEPRDIAAEILATMGDPVGLRAKAELAQRVAREEFDIEVAARRHLELYESLLWKERP